MLESLRIEFIRVASGLGMSGIDEIPGEGVTSPILGLSGAFDLNASPSPTASRIGKTKVQKRASGCLVNSRNRTSVS
jgi:hypothetical protein